MIFLGPLGEADEVARLQAPVRRGNHAGAGHVVTGNDDEAQPGEQVADHGAGENRKFADDERNFAPAEGVEQRGAMIVFAIEHGKVAPVGAGVMQPDNFGSDPLRLFFGSAKFDHADFFAFPVFSGEGFGWEQGRFFVVLDDFTSDAQDALGGAVILGQRDQEFLRTRTKFSVGDAAKALQKYGETAEGRAAETIDGLIVVADRNDVAAVAGQQPKQFELGNIGVLKFVHQNVAVFILNLLAQRVVASQQMCGVHQLCAESEQVPLAEKLIADAIDAGEFFLPGDFLFGGLQGIRFEGFFLLLVRGAEGLHVFLIIIGSDQFILAAREKGDEVADEFAGILQAAKKFQVKFADITAQQNFVVDIFERLHIGIGCAQDLIQTKLGKGAEPNAFGALSN